MPEVHFEVRWPDGTERRYYSPSTAIHSHMARGDSYRVEEFVARAKAAMHAASERVRAKYGYTCSSAMDTLGQIEETAAQFSGPEPGNVTVTDMK